jgi:hypothetical protein
MYQLMTYWHNDILFTVLQLGRVTSPFNTKAFVCGSHMPGGKKDSAFSDKINPLGR